MGLKRGARLSVGVQADLHSARAVRRATPFGPCRRAVFSNRPKAPTDECRLGFCYDGMDSSRFFGIMCR
jgi:hypothetical protein